MIEKELICQNNQRRQAFFLLHHVSLLNIFYSVLHNFNIFPPLPQFFLHPHSWIPSSIVFFSLLNFFIPSSSSSSRILLFPSSFFLFSSPPPHFIIYFSIHDHIDPTSHPPHTQLFLIQLHKYWNYIPPLPPPHFYCFSPPPPPHFTTFLLFSLLLFSYHTGYWKGQTGQTLAKKTKGRPKKPTSGKKMPNSGQTGQTLTLCLIGKQSEEWKQYKCGAGDGGTQ